MPIDPARSALYGAPHDVDPDRALPASRAGCIEVSSAATRRPQRSRVIWLKRILIHRLRGVVPGTELNFSQGINVLLGQNGAGKTTLLELCAAVLSGNFSHFANEPFHVEGEIRCGEELFEVSVQGFGAFESSEDARYDQPNLPLLSAGETIRSRSWHLNARYVRGDSSWSVESSGLGGTLEVAGQRRQVRHASPLEGPVYASFVVGLFQPPALWTEGLGHLQFWLVRSDRVFRFDEGLGAFDKFLAQDESGPHATLRQGTSGVGLWTNDFPDTIVRRWGSEDLGPALEQDSLTVTDTPWLTDFAEWLGADGVTYKLRRISKSVQDGRRVVVFAKPELEIRLSDKLTVLQDGLSFGQKRLFAFLHMLALNPSSPVIADELVNGLHHSWIQRCLSKIEGSRQAFLASQNPLLLDHLEFDDPSEARSAFIICTFDRDSFHWRQMTEQESEDFFESYALGIQHVGTILRTRGLW